MKKRFVQSNIPGMLKAGKVFRCKYCNKFTPGTIGKWYDRQVKNGFLRSLYRCPQCDHEV